MNEKIYPKKINGKVYYYLQTTYREKINPKDTGKSKGSGKSKVKTKSIYLGTAESIMKKLFTHKEPVEIINQEMGLVGACYNLAKEIGLIKLLQKHIKGKRYGIDNWKYFLLAIINRIDNSTSKEKMGEWASKTILPDILDFDPKQLNSKSFWYASDDIINERELQERREKNSELKQDLQVGIDDNILKQIQKEFARNIQEKYQLISDVFLYDTTNFFTFFKEPLRSLLARPTKSKTGRNNLKHTGLALCVDKQWGIPLFHSLYRANSHDTKTFYQTIDELTHLLKNHLAIENMILILDKGNNSQDNFDKLKDNIEWIGSLKVSDYQDLIDIDLDKYTSQYKDFNYYSTQKHIMGIVLKLVLTYNDKLYRKQLNSLESGIERLKQRIRKKWSEYKRTPKRVPKGIKTILSENHYKKYISVSCRKGKPVFTEQKKVIELKKQRFGKSLLFSSQLDKECSEIINLYHSKDKIEDGIKLLKDPHLISWQPMRHWTDSKIRTFAFCNVMALVIIRMMEYKTVVNDIKMSPQVLKQELKDIKKAILVYDEKTAKPKITHRSTVQNKLWEIFNLETLE